MKIYITTCDKRIGYAQKIKEMLRGSPYEYFFVYGKDNTQKVEPSIEVDVKEAYENLPEKTFCLIEHFFNKFTDEKLVKVDDDNFLDVVKLKQYETALEDYIGYFHNYEQRNWHDSYFHWYKIQNPEYKREKKQFKLDYAEGAMYILSRKACEKVLKDGRGFFKNTPESYLGEDVRVGMSLNDDSIVKKDIKELIPLSYEITKDFMSIHPIGLLMFDKLKDAKTNEEKEEILIRFNYLNENIRREEFLKKIKPTPS